jgi:protein-S-isoprenylcysteine O-methyltransferase Ste14
MPAYAYAILAAGWIAWLIPFFLRKRNSPAAQQRDKRARWGVVVQSIAYSLEWQNPFWARPLESWRVPLSVLFFTIAAAFSWTAVRTLGRQWRIDAGLNADHELIRSGPYRIVRHPIYTSMLCLLLGVGFLITPLWLLGVSTLVMIIGTEIRVRIEERLLASRFGDEFHDYQQRVGAYVPRLV